CGVVNRRRQLVSVGVALRQVQDVRCVLVVIVGPVSNWPQSGTSGEHSRLGKHRHQRDESAVTSPVYSYPIRIHSMLAYKPAGWVNLIVQVFAAHVPVDPGSPITSISRRTTVVAVKHHVSMFHQEVMEHVLPVVIGRPPAMNVLQVPCSVNKYDRR